MNNIIDKLITIRIKDNKATLNKKAENEFQGKDIKSILLNINLNKEIEIIYISKDLYAVNIIKADIYILIFTKITDTQNLLKTIRNDEKNNKIELYSRDMLKEFLEKFLALKKRYGGFHIKVLYLKINFTINFKQEIEQKALNSILKYAIAITRSSDVIGEISQRSFAIILTNPSTEGANIISNKINDYITKINLNNGRRIIEVYGATINELFLLKHDFDDIITKADKESHFIQVGSKLIEII